MAEQDSQVEAIEPLHPAERRLLAFLRALKFGTVERLVIRNGVPMLADVVTKTVKFD